MKRPTSNDFVLLFRTYWNSYDAAIQSYCQDLEARLKRAEGLLRKCIYQHVPKNIPLYHMIKEALKDLGKEDRMTDSIDPIVRSLKHAEEIIAKGPNGPAWPDISPHQIKAEKE